MTINGTDRSETLVGTNGSDTINALGGDDALFGKAGNDTLKGGDGGDELDGGAGRDILDGGTGGFGVDTADYRSFNNGVNVNLLTGKAEDDRHRHVDFDRECHRHKFRRHHHRRSGRNRQWLYSGFGVVGHRAEEPIVIATC